LPSLFLSNFDFSQNDHRCIARRTFAGFVDCYSAIFEFFALGLVNQSCFCLDCRCDILPRTIGTIPTLNLIRDNPSGVNGLFPIEKYPALALLGRFKLSRLAGRGKGGWGSGYPTSRLALTCHRPI